jgi:hypothetical protein
MRSLDFFAVESNTPNGVEAPKKGEGQSRIDKPRPQGTGREWQSKGKVGHTARETDDVRENPNQDLRGILTDPRPQACPTKRATQGSDCAHKYKAKGGRMDGRARAIISGEKDQTVDSAEEPN